MWGVVFVYGGYFLSDIDEKAGGEFENHAVRLGYMTLPAFKSEFWTYAGSSPTQK